MVLKIHSAATLKNKRLREGFWKLPVAHNEKACLRAGKT